MAKIKTGIGGQAVMEGIMMKGPEHSCLVLRTPEGELIKEMYDTAKNPVEKIPILRGVVAMVYSLKDGYKYLMRSAEIAVPDDSEDKFEQWLTKHFGDKVNAFVGALAAVLAGFLSIGLFVLLPTVLTGLLSAVLPIDGFKTLIEGVLKVIIFIGYIALASRLEDIKRVFSYHGAEHKTIFCYEDGCELTVENVRRYGKYHPRCGTSFLFIVLIISILVFSFVPWTTTLTRVLYKLICLPLIMGLSYECIKYSGKHENLLSKILSAPGIWVQHLTVFEPDDSMIEVAIEAMKAVIPENSEEAQL